MVVWDVISGCGLFRLRGHKGPISGCRWLHHGNTLITSSKDCLVKFWDLETQHCFQTLVDHKSEVIIMSSLATVKNFVVGVGYRSGCLGDQISECI